MPLRPAHHRRLRAVWRSAGWPCHDALELDLLAAGLLLRVWDDQGRETLRVSDAAITVMAAARQKHCAAFGAHERLVEQVARLLQRDGRIAWRGLSLRAPLPGINDGAATRWVVAMPDVYSIRNTTVEDYTEATVHEVKVSRADLLADLRRADKGAAYRALSSQCWYVLRTGIAHPNEVPVQFGVMLASGDGLDVARTAPRRPLRLPFAVWMALAKCPAVRADDGASTPELCNADP